MNEDLKISDRVVIPAADLDERFDTHGGPGGQHANRNETAVTLSVDLDMCGGLSDAQRRRAIENLGGGSASVVVADSRSQWRNRQLARHRLAELIGDSIKPPPPPRRKTKPSRAARARRLDSKRRRGEVKKARKRPDY
jgi:ribosome-associated protein